MKALTLIDPCKFAYGEAPEPEIGPEDVLIEVKACGICGSDIHGMDGSSGRRIPPIIMGHEASGVIAKIGQAVQCWSVGDSVTFDSTVYCGACSFCRAGDVNLCVDRRVLGVSCGDYRQHGAFAQFVAVPARILYGVPEGLSHEQAAFAEPVSIALHAVRRVPIKPGDSAVVVGSGLIGLLVIQALKIAGAGKILAVDLDERRLELAKQLGADHGLKANDPLVIEQIQAATGGLGADIAMEVVGISPAVNLAVNSLRRGGSLGLVGNLAAKIDFPLQAVVTREIGLFGSCGSAGEYPDAIQYIRDGRMNVAPLISGTAPLAEGADWFQRLYDNKEGLLKVILQP